MITDPPYGIKRDKGFGGALPFGNGSGKPIERKKYTGEWDNERPDKKHFDHLIRVSKIAIVWGGNFFSDLLPVGNHWLVWDKLNTMPSFGDCELAWSNIKRNSVKKVTREYNGLIGKEETREHPTQKPLGLMLWCIETYTHPGDLVFDPFMGSGTTGVACMQLGRNFIGCERNPAYFEIAKARIEAAALQPPLFIDPPAPASPPQQARLDGMG